MTNNLGTLLTTAAELRSGGMSWETIGQRVRRSAHTCKSWPSRYPDLWNQAYRLAQQRRLDEAGNEALHFLREVLREADYKTKVKCADVVFRLNTLYKKMQADPSEQDKADAERWRIQEAALDEVCKSMAATRASKGLPPGTREELMHDAAEWLHDVNTRYYTPPNSESRGPTFPTTAMLLALFLLGLAFLGWGRFSSNPGPSAIPYKDWVQLPNYRTDLRINRERSQAASLSMFQTRCFMMNQALKDQVLRIVQRVTTPAQYIGGELNSIVKDHRQVRGKLCLAFPDAYTLGMSHHGLQVLYTIMNQDPQWACERAFTPWLDWETELRKNHLPLYSLETFTPLNQFDLVGFSLQYEVCYTNVLTMLDLGGIPHFSNDRTVRDPLIIAGGPGAQNPELLAPFIDLFVIGDGEESLPWVMEKWMTLKEVALREGDTSFARRQEMLAELVGSTTWAYAPMFYEPEYHADGTLAAMHRTRSDVPKEVMACTIQQDLEEIPLPTKPVVPFVQTPHDRIAIEIMRGCPWQCRFCQSTVIKRPLRIRSVETIVQAALDSYRNTGSNEISLLSLSSSDYPYFEELVKRMHEVFHPLGVNVSLPSLRINHQLRSLPSLIKGVRKAGLTLAPEVARDDMREQIRKKIKNEDLYEGCKEAFKNGWSRVKLYFLCGLPGERPADLDGIIEMAETIAKIGKEVRGRYADVTASVSNFVPKPHTPYQWNGQQSREYFRWAGEYLRSKKTIRSVTIKQHDIETSLLEGILTRGDRRVAPALYEAWKRGARMDGWKECFQPELWWKTFADLGIDVAFYSQRQRPMNELLPWDHVNVKKGRAYLEKEQERSIVQLQVMATL